MKFTKHTLIAALLTGLAAGVMSARADERHEHGDKTTAAKPYPSAKCLISGEAHSNSLSRWQEAKQI